MDEYELRVEMVRREKWNASVVRVEEGITALYSFSLVGK
jgi:hypothetical protein